MLPPVTVIVPFSRPHRARAVIETLARQSYASPVRLVLVENGPAVGTVRCDDPRLVVISSAHGHASAMNAGLDWLRARGGGAWARMDDDDWYGPTYLRDQFASMLVTGADVVGKTWGFVRLQDGLYLFDNPRLCWDSGHGLTGGTICAGHASVPRFEDRQDDDTWWCNSARGAGLKVWATSEHGYVYDRSQGGPRVYGETRPAVVRRSLSPRGCQYYGDAPNEVADDLDARPLRTLPPTTDAEVFASMGAA
jgi:glycosyltransferase involved in cell wall biosynthesis